MKRLFQVLGIVTVIWMLTSFAGVMFDMSSRLELWTASLLWSILASAVLAPVFIFIGSEDANSGRNAQKGSSSPPQNSSSPSTNTSSSPPPSQQAGQDWPYRSDQPSESEGRPNGPQ